MRRFFSLRLAIQGIRKNGKFYIPYLLAATGCVAMFYVLTAIATDGGLLDMRGGEALAYMMGFGCYIVALFSAIVLFYTNSFLMKRRQKEMGLYNLLGMEKRHIARILSLETLVIALCGISLGLLTGMLFTKLIHLLLYRLTGIAAPVSAAPNARALLVSALLFAGIFALVLLSNVLRLRRTQAIDLLKGGQVGEREPKANWVLAVLGALFLGGGYYLAITIQSPVEALMFFFLAVLLVILGTYALFTAGSVVVLKSLRKNPRFYYQPQHFMAISGMIHRMKQNAVGLSNICILSTMVLVMVSGTCSLYFGVNSVINLRYPTDFLMRVPSKNVEERDNFLKEIDGVLKANGLQARDLQSYEMAAVLCAREGEQLVVDPDVVDRLPKLFHLCLLTAEEYARLTGEPVMLAPDEALLYAPSASDLPSFTLPGKTFRVARRLTDFPVGQQYSVYLEDIFMAVLPAESDLRAVAGAADSDIDFFVAFDTDGTDAANAACVTQLSALADELGVDCRAVSRASYYSLIGGFLFLGLFLGLLFLMATVLIIYYKQISEGYEDARRFEVMQQVGMSRKEVKNTIRKQILMVFYLPILVAVLHIAMAFPMITRLLSLFALTDVKIFMLCTLSTVAAFCAIYALVYLLTAKVYDRIVMPA